MGLLHPTGPMAVGLLKPAMTWPWQKLDALAGEVIVAAAAAGNGKSTFIANLIDGLVTQSCGYHRMTIATLEQSPELGVGQGAQRGEGEGEAEDHGDSRARKERCP